MQRAPGETSKLGWFEEILLPVGDVKAAARFWEQIGFVPTEESEQPFPEIGLTSDSLDVVLVGGGAFSRPALRFTHAAMSARIRALADKGVEFARMPGKFDPTQNALLIAPEGTQLLLTTAE